ncbi:MAG: class I SAM-dependent methyltransferase [Acidimicrobiia bacterium]
MPEPGTDYITIAECRSCRSRALTPVVDLGLLPLSDGLVPPGFDRSGERVYPLTVVFCQDCSLMQIRETVDPQTLFGDEYPYYSSFSDLLVEHARENVEGIIRRTGVEGDSLVVELASNDGYLLQWFVEAGVPVLGIDPAPGPARAAQARGIPTLNEFFDVGLAQRLADGGTRADVIVGNNVLAHVPDVNAFVEAMAILLAENGTVVMEFPYVRDLIENCEFDTIYHEHHCYFSVSSVTELFARHELNLIAVEHHDIHGGSLRVWFDRHSEPDAEVGRYLSAEREAGMLGPDHYRSFAKRVEKVKTEMIALLDRIAAEGSTVAAYGAAAKGAILVNYCGIGDRLSYVVDRNDHKQGLEMPGVAVAIVGPERLRQDPADYLLLLAWNFKDEIMRQQAEYARGGGRFIIPIPTPAIV